MIEFFNDFLIPLIPSLCFLGMCLHSKKQRERIEELEKENENLRTIAEWNIHNM